MKKYEHVRIYIAPTDQAAIDKMLTDMGEDGWRLVGVNAHPPRNDFHFEREKETT